jgi:hypothetical protein
VTQRQRLAKESSMLIIVEISYVCHINLSTKVV